ncbi:hypothetical protein CDL12_17332 [Handroanthus impetiginosus]|uniref:Uncharacterized protein n=1 Tax=Handroanthus impetiginosus TaxID=429701 RepID=A0A2G9GYJ4_9LAMI|nr:hypothetical protein CDL12_17332 [Handroanthus impetiginosus]
MSFVLLPQEKKRKKERNKRTHFAFCWLKADRVKPGIILHIFSRKRKKKKEKKINPLYIFSLFFSFTFLANQRRKEDRSFPACLF